MRRTAIFLSLVALAGFFLHATDFKVEEKEEIRRTLKFADPAAAKRFEIDNMFGSIEVIGEDRSDVSLVALKTIKARSAEDLKLAKEEVTLDLSEEKNEIVAYVDGPFRCNCSCSDGSDCKDKKKRRRRWDPGYEVQFDFKVLVPRRVDLFLSTVSGGNIQAKNVAGSLEVRNVNGRIELADVDGAVEAETVNGGIKTYFNRVPPAACSFKTINGKLELYFPDNLRADFRLKSFNGEAYSDFPVTRLPALPATQERKEGKFVYKSDKFVGVRVGDKGGPEIKLDTFNGDIYINKNKA